MAETLPRTHCGFQSLARVLLVLCLLGLVAAGSPTKRSGKHRPPKRASRSLEVVRSAAHLEADPKNMDHVIWKNGRDDTLIQGDLTLVEEEENMKVLINQTGLYFVYTQATFDCTRFIYRKPSHISRISHQVKLFSIKQNEDINLLSAHKTISTGGPTSIYEGGLFMLNSGDKLYTVTNSSDCVIMKRKGGETYFGLYAW